MRELLFLDLDLLNHIYYNQFLVVESQVVLELELQAL